MRRLRRRRHVTGRGRLLSGQEVVKAIPWTSGSSAGPGQYALEELRSRRGIRVGALTQAETTHQDIRGIQAHVDPEHPDGTLNGQPGADQQGEAGSDLDRNQDRTRPPLRRPFGAAL